VTHLPRPDRDDLHVAYAIGRPVGSAVRRNRVRRRLRSALTDLGRLGRAPVAGDLLVRAQPGAARASYQELEEHLDRCFVHLAGST
jgi:ribonuclease P protein component